MTWLSVAVRVPGDLDGRWICGALISMQGLRSVCGALSLIWHSVVVVSQSGYFSPSMGPQAWHFYLFIHLFICYFEFGAYPKKKIVNQIRWVYSFWNGVPGPWGPQKVRTSPWGNPGYTAVHDIVLPLADPDGLSLPGLCSTHESWVKFDSTLTQMSRVRVESAVKIKDMSRVRVESRWSSFESELSQLDTAWVKVESLIFLKRKRQDFVFICILTEKEPTYS